jgi:hypothetical protein
VTMIPPVGIGPWADAWEEPVGDDGSERSR